MPDLHIHVSVIYTNYSFEFVIYQPKNCSLTPIKEILYCTQKVQPARADPGFLIKSEATRSITTPPLDGMLVYHKISPPQHLITLS